MSPTRTGPDRRPDAPPGDPAAGRFAPPPLPDGLVVRPRLLAVLDGAAAHPFTLVSAPAGTGKTVTVASWAVRRGRPGPLAWIPLSPSNADPTPLWTVLVDALREVGVAVRGRVPVTPDGAPAPAALAALAADVARHPVPVVVVLDCDAQLGPAACDGLRDLLHDSAGRLRLLVLTRADPPLPLHRWALEGTSTELRMGQLAFTDDEARDLLRRRGVGLPDEVFALLMQRTHGWAAGLLLAAMSLLPLRDRERAARELTGAGGTVAEYLLTEVLDVQTPLARDLLLRTSVVEVLRPGLAEALAGPKAARALGVLARGNAFLEPLPDRLDCFRYHPLFRDLLYAQLRLESADEADRLHLVAADWAAGEGLLDEAVRHALAAGRPGHAARLVVDDLAVTDLLAPVFGGLAAGSGAAAALRDALAADPGETDTGADDDSDANANANADAVAGTLARAAIAVAAGERGRARALLRTARAGLAELGALWPAADLAVALVDTALAADGAHLAESDRTVGEAERLLSAQRADRLAAHPEIRAWLSTVRASTALRRADLDLSRELLESAATGPTRPGLEVLQVQALGRLALLAAWSGLTRRATRLATEALDLQRDAGVLPTPDTAAAHVALAWSAAEGCDLGEARRQATAAQRTDHAAAAAGDVRADPRADGAAAGAPAGAAAGAAVGAAAGEPRAGADDPLTRVLTAVVLARIRRAHGDVDGARAALAGARRAEETPQAGGPALPAPDWLRDHLLLEEAALDLLHERTDPTAPLALPEHVAGPAGEWADLVRTHDSLARGEGLDAPVAPEPHAAAPLPVQVDRWLLESLRQVRRGDERRAVEALEHSLRLAEPETLRRPFREAPAEVRRLLRTRPELARRHRWLAWDGTEGGAGSRRAVRTLAAAGRDDTGAGTGTTLVVEALTQKEREVLAHLAELLTTEEIAGAMFVSVNTVRTHVRNILRKLGVSRRNEAIRRARDLQIL